MSDRPVSHNLPRGAPPDRLRLPTLTEELSVPGLSPGLAVTLPVLTHSFQPSVNSPPLEDPDAASRVAALAAGPIAAGTMAADEQRAMQVVSVAAPAKPAAPAPAGLAAVSTQPPSVQLQEPRPIQSGPPMMIAPWVHTVVKDAIEEAMSHVVPQVIEAVNAHVRRRLEEASRNPNRNLF